MSFIELGGRLVREEAINIISTDTAAGVLDPQYYAYVDGNAISISEVEYHQLKKKFDSKNRKRSA